MEKYLCPKCEGEGDLSPDQECDFCEGYGVLEFLGDEVDGEKVFSVVRTFHSNTVHHIEEKHLICQRVISLRE